MSKSHYVDLDMKDNDILNLLTGIIFTNSSSVVSTDGLRSAIGKLQSQLNFWNELIKSTADVISSSNTTLTNVSDLQFNAIAGKSYWLEYMIRFRTAATTTGFTVGINTTNGAVGELDCQANLPVSADGTAALYTGSITSLGDLVTSTGVGAIQPTTYICNIKGIFICTTSGIIVPQFRSEVNGSNVNFRQNSMALIREF